MSSQKDQTDETSETEYSEWDPNVRERKRQKKTVEQRNANTTMRAPQVIHEADRGWEQKKQVVIFLFVKHVFGNIILLVRIGMPILHSNWTKSKFSLQSIKQRVFWSVLMVGGFLFLTVMGHFFVACLVLLLTTGMFSEIIALKRNVEKDNKVQISSNSLTGERTDSIHFLLPLNCTPLNCTPLNCTPDSNVPHVTLVLLLPSRMGDCQEARWIDAS